MKITTWINVLNREDAMVARKAEVILDLRRRLELFFAFFAPSRLIFFEESDS